MSKANIAERINRAWRLVVEQGASASQAARELGTTENRVNRIVSALLARRNKLAQDAPFAAHAATNTVPSRK